MKVCEVITDDVVMKTDIKRNKGKAIAAIVRGQKRKSNGTARKDNDVPSDTMTVMQ